MTGLKCYRFLERGDASGNHTGVYGGTGKIPCATKRL